MEQSDLREPSPGQPLSGNPASAAAPANSRSGSCPSCGCGAQSSVAANSSPFIYVIGGIDVQFSRLSVEKEIAQAARMADTARLTDRQTCHKVLSQAENRYLLRQVCFTLTIRDLETYILKPADPSVLDLLVGALRPTRSPMDLNVVVGVRGPTAALGECNSMMLPIVLVDQLWAFDRPSLIADLKPPEKMPQKEFAAAADELFDRIMQMAYNMGETDEKRAINYLAVRCAGIYTTTAEAFARNCSLSAVLVRPSPLSGARKMLDVVFTYTNRGTGVDELYSVCTDVTDQYPFQVTKVSPYYIR